MRMKRSVALAAVILAATPTAASAATPTESPNDSFVGFLSRLWSQDTKIEPWGVDVWGDGGPFQNPFKFPQNGAPSVPWNPAPVTPTAPAPETPTTPAAASSGTIHGVFAHDAVDDKPGGGKVDEFAEVTGHPVQLWQISPQRAEGNAGLVGETQRTIGLVPAGLAVDYSIPIVGHPLDNSNPEVMTTEAATEVGKALAAHDGAVYVRPGWEFNLDQSWAWTTSRIGDQAYIDGFRATVDALRAANPNVRIVWNPNSGQGGVDRAMQAYPGDEHVDVIGVDVYDWSNEDVLNGPGQLNEWAAKARELGKTIALPEYGAHGKQGRGDNPDFIRIVFDWQARNAGLVEYMSYFTEDGGDYIDNVPGRQLPLVGEALRERLPQLADTGGTSPTAVPDLTPAPTASAAPGTATETPSASLVAAQDGSEQTFDTPSGVTHDLSGEFGRIIARAL